VPRHHPSTRRRDRTVHDRLRAVGKAVLITRCNSPSTRLGETSVGTTSASQLQPRRLAGLLFICPRFSTIVRQTSDGRPRGVRFEVFACIHASE
jgi:hypothetical protein